MAGNSKSPGRSVISKISSILLAVADANGLTLTELISWSKLPSSTVHRLVNELAAWGLLERDDVGRYRAGGQLAALVGATRVPTAVSRSSPRERIAPVLDDLFGATGMQVRGGFLIGHEVAYVQKLGEHLPVSAFADAARLPAHATALGKALMAFSPPAVVDPILARGLKRYTKATVTRPERLRQLLQTIRITHLAVCDRELDQDWSGVAAPVFGPGGNCVAALEVRVTELARDLPTVRALLVLAAGCLSRELTTAQGRRPSPVEHSHGRTVVSTGGSRT